jgi:DNA-binding response OmpR family regulator
MHIQDNKSNVLCLGSSDFNSSIKELREYLDFKSIFTEDISKDLLSNKYSIILIDNDILESPQILKKINSAGDKIKILIGKVSKAKNFKYDEFLDKPLKISDLNNKVIKLVAGKKFLKNSSIQIKDYILDKNEKKFKKNKSFIIITEKEVQLLELLFLEKKPLSKKTILNKVWNYSSSADTHTVETHIYRLRKKIADNFKDNQLISNTKEGYSI